MTSATGSTRLVRVGLEIPFDAGGAGPGLDRLARGFNQQFQIQQRSIRGCRTAAMREACDFFYFALVRKARKGTVSGAEIEPNLHRRSVRRRALQSSPARFQHPEAAEKGPEHGECKPESIFERVLVMEDV